MKYIKLTDRENRDVIVKLSGRECYEYIIGDNARWSRTGIIEYYTEKSDKYEKYVEISEDKANEEITYQIHELKKIYSLIIAKTEENRGEKNELIRIIIDDEADNLEESIVGIIYAMGHEFFQQYRSILDNVSRIQNSIEILFLLDNYKDENDLVRIRKCRNTCENAIRIIDYKYEVGDISKIKYNVLYSFFNQEIIFLSDEQKEVVL